MPVKASDFFVDVVAFFAIVLPGGVVAFLGLLRIELSRVVPVPPFLSGVAGWVAFFAAAFLLGHALYAVGSWFLDHIYNRTYRPYKNKIKGDPGDPVRKIIQEQFPDPPRPTAFPWARAYIGVRNAAAAAAVDELEADSKFFRSLTVALIIGPYVFLPDRFGNFAWLGGAASIVVLGIGVGLAQRADIDDGKKKGDRVASRPSKLLDVAAVLYSLVFGVLLVAAPLVVPTGAPPWLAVTYWVITVCSFLRFTQLRWQRNETAYEFFLSIRQLEIRTSPASAPVTGGGVPPA